MKRSRPCFSGSFILEVLVSAEIRAEDLFLCFLMLMMTLSGLYGNIHLGIGVHVRDHHRHCKPHQICGADPGSSAFCRVNRVDFKR